MEVMVYQVELNISAFYNLHKKDTKGENQSKRERCRENKGPPSYNSYNILIFLHPSSLLYSLSLSEFISVSAEVESLLS